RREMDYPYEDVTLTNIGGGAAVELFDRELQEVLKNIQDPNTPARKKRLIQIQISLTPNENREHAQVEIHVNSKLAAVVPKATLIYLGEDVEEKRHLALQFKGRQKTFEDLEESENVVAMKRKDGSND